MVEVGAARAFSARHRLPLPDGSIHDDGHDYRVELVVRGEQLSADGMLLDLDVLGAALDRCVGALAERQLDALAVFDGRPTTVENVADHLWRTLHDALGDAAGLSSMRVTVFESADAWAAIDRSLES